MCPGMGNDGRGGWEGGCCPRIQFVPGNVITNMCILCNFQILTTITLTLHIIGGKLGGLPAHMAPITTITWIYRRHNPTSLCFCLDRSLDNSQTTDMIYFLNINSVDCEFNRITINIIRFGFKISEKG